MAVATKPADADLLNAGAKAIRDLSNAAGVTDRVQLRVSWPNTVTINEPVKYTRVIRDSHGGWNSNNWTYAVQKAGLYLACVAYKCSGTSYPSQKLVRTTPNAAVLIAGPNAAVGDYVGAAFSGMFELAYNDILQVQEQAASYNAQNDGDGSNFLHLAYLGPVFA